MTVTCPRCLRSLAASGSDGPPAFCMYCGQKLRDTASADMATAAFTPTGGPELEAADDPSPPAAVGGYKLLRLLGAGGMGQVYEAETPGAGGRVAVKLLSP